MFCVSAAVSQALKKIDITAAVFSKQCFQIGRGLESHAWIDLFLRVTLGKAHSRVPRATTTTTTCAAGYYLHLLHFFVEITLILGQAWKAMLGQTPLL